MNIHFQFQESLHQEIWNWICTTWYIILLYDISYHSLINPFHGASDLCNAHCASCCLFAEMKKLSRLALLLHQCWTYITIYIMIIYMIKYKTWLQQNNWCLFPDMKELSRVAAAPILDIPTFSVFVQLMRRWYVNIRQLQSEVCLC